jgi:hypothetical protein
MLYIYFVSFYDLSFKEVPSKWLSSMVVWVTYLCEEVPGCHHIIEFASITLWSPTNEY